MIVTSAKRRAFTLMELLIAVAIFSGLAVLTLGIFARSAASSLKTNVSRTRTEAARTVVDRITADLRYAYYSDVTNNYAPESQAHSCFYNVAGAPVKIRGWQFEQQNNCLEMVLKYPRDDSYIWKKYQVDTVNNRLTMTVSELRDCQIDATMALSGCITQTPSFSDLLPSQYQTEVPLDAPVFKGISAYQAAQSNPPLSGLLSLRFSVKPTKFADSCQNDATQCYTLSTTITSGGSQ